MNRYTSPGKKFQAIAGLVIAVVFLAPSYAAAESQDDKWKFRLDIYGWLPSVGGNTKFLDAGGGSDVSIDAGDIINSLEGVFMGGLTAQKGRWGVFADLIYIDLSNGKSSTRSMKFSRFEIPADANLSADLDLSGWVVTAAGTYRAIEKPNYSLNVLGGARYLSTDEELKWGFSGNVAQVPVESRSGDVSANRHVWDAIVGVRGRAKIGESKWYVPYYLDIGTGESEFTWQAMAGAGYAFRSLDLLVAYRHLNYDFGSDNGIKDLYLSGPLVSVSFHW